MYILTELESKEQYWSIHTTKLAKIGRLVKQNFFLLPAAAAVDQKLTRVARKALLLSSSWPKKV
jgi:hypothetical protein